MAAGASNLPIEPASGEASVEAPLCHNCGAIAPGKFCSACGQTTVVHMPTLFEFLHEFISHHVAFEGTLVASLKRLLFTPGGLTLDYFAGKRARYVAPLRLYLTFNVVFFLAIQFFQMAGLGSGNQDADAKKALAQVKLSDATAAIQAASKEIMADPELTTEQREAAVQKLTTLEQFAARASLPDAITHPASAAGALGQPGALTSDSSAAGSSAAGSSAVPDKPSSLPPLTLNLGKPPTGDAANSSGSALPTQAVTLLGHAPPSATDADDDKDDDEDAASNLKDARQEVLESARDAAAAAAPVELPKPKTAGAKPNSETLKKVENSTIPSWVDRYMPIVRRRINEVGERTPDQNLQHLRENGLRYAPYTLLALLPVCAFLLQMSFVGRRRGYVENLVSALHGHTFLFIVLLVVVPLQAVSGLAAAIWMLLALVHMIWAMSRIYGSRGIGLFMRLGVLAVTYGLALIVATIFAFFISVLT